MTRADARARRGGKPEAAAAQPQARARRWWTLSGWLAFAAVASPLIFAGALHVALERLGPLPVVTAEPTSAVVLDRKGRLLRPFANELGRWRLPADAGEVDPRYVELLLAYEDKRFFSHRGVDPLALARAAGQLIANGRVVSGGSTLTMQVARLIEPGRSRSVRTKLRQMLRAVQLEARFSKREILRLYLTLAPFGGNLEGVRAASLAYFGKEPRRLTLDEAALLIALPQSPEARRPDRFSETAQAARDKVLERAVRAGVVSAADAARAKSRPVPQARHDFPMLAAHVAQRQVADEPGRRVHRLTIDRDLQARLEEVARARVLRFGNRHSVAIIVVDNPSGEVLAHVGSAGYLDARRAGQMDMTRAVRSPGSALKPFIYGLAFEAGLAHPQTLIEDRPRRFGAYAPRNFDADYRGTVTVREALQLSLNVPAVQLLDAVGPVKLVARLRGVGARIDLPDAAAPELPVALGGAGIRLADMAALYSSLARLGRPVRLHYRLGRSAALPDEGGELRPRRLLNPVAAWYVADILRGTPPPAHAEWEAIALKTGTSYGYRDAWAAGFDGRHTVAVWVGRPDGGPTPGMTGRLAAAPLLMEVFARLGSRRAPLPPPPKGVLRAATAELPPPLREFGGPVGHDREAADPAVRIAFPLDGARVALAQSAPGAPDTLAFKAEGGALPLTWFVNGAPFRPASRERTLFWMPDGEGFVHLTVVDAKGVADNVVFRLEAEPPRPALR